MKNITNYAARSEMYKLVNTKRTSTKIDHFENLAGNLKI